MNTMSSLTVYRNDLTEEGMYKISFLNENYVIDPDWIKNKKKILEVLATKFMYPEATKVKTFRQTKSVLVDMITPYIQFKNTENPVLWKRGGILPPGEYYIGDLCYAMDDEVYDDIWGKKYDYKDGQYSRKDGSGCFAVHGTEWGDGEFEDDDGDTYLVDAGIIGVASKSICSKGVEDGCKFVKFDEPVDFFYEEGKFYINSLCIREKRDESDDESDDDY